MAEEIYHYFQDQPSYNPTKFSIIGGINELYNEQFALFLEKVGAGDSDTFYDVSHDKILVLENSAPKNKSASTIDSKLLELFINLESTVDDTIPIPKKQKKGAVENDEKSTDEIVHGCADLMENSDDSDIENDTTEQSENTKPEFNEQNNTTDISQLI